MPYHADLLATPVPRYTSYPTAAEFHDGIGPDDQARALGRVREHAPVSLYVHIPFCEKICFYCGCNTGAAGKAARLERYMAALHAEIDMVAAKLEGRGRVVRVALGGGSPNALTAAQLDALAARLTDAFGGDHASWSIEIDPRSLTPDFAEAMARIGFERASLGVQSFDPAIQAAIGRVQPEEMIAAATMTLREAGVTSLNFDLMYGLPGQDAALLADNLERAVALSPDRLAVFGYAHVPHIVPRQKVIDARALPGAPERFAQADIARMQLVEAGYRAIGFDHFARPHDPLAKAADLGRVRRNFQGYTDDPCETLIGLGASSISRLPGLLVQTEKNSGRYALRASNGLLSGNRGIALEPLDVLRGRVIERLLCNGSTRLDLLPDRARIAERLQPFLERGLARLDDGRLQILEEGWPYARAMAARLDPWREQSQRQFSSAV
ncbi:oxygen-independent coproporphyrinogen III oxidase [Sphingomicrobium aestuariivivum]|uniref:oxygen-independent coproporphyrinogen III oxidase n=1 Tax=Sphingomicrobium aestuariivivum TaxID=1582356 RepID=UPI001FD707DD|nr:oxygen-independent coproporphyrinogen III oxidase [Sphingomicrobium aestuariivivum]MCJ8191284.1 oxygen-independent coproporphyrinogen III oxidase [Sphingomicrobium aestuariivivum]